MDQISVSEDGLRQAYTALQDFQTNTEAITKLCTDLLDTRKSTIDDTFRNDLMKYVQLLNQWNARVYNYTIENQVAIAERMKALEAYCSTVYTKRSF